MKKLILENFRCFRAHQEVNLAPLTLLVGENSTGKSSFLGAVRIAWTLGSREKLPDFNEEPFQFGAYEQIANYRGGRAGRAKFFSIGYEDTILIDRTKRNIKIIAIFRQQGIQPQLTEWCLESQNYQIMIVPGDRSAKLTIKTPKTPHLPLSIPFSGQQGILDFLNLMLFSLNTVQIEQTEIEYLKSIVLHILIYLASNRPYAIAPIRTKPKRTYDPIQERPEPEGGHIPMVLARIVSDDLEEWLPLKKALENFGKACGLFEEIEVKKLGTSESSPFQIQTKIKGPAANLLDVGYGVSQVIPILVDGFRSAKNQILLLQQPEVHLHPRAQAELGTFLANLVKHDQKQFIVETHSDYLVDRVCMDVRDGKTLKPEDVLILFFERTDSEVIIHPITVDQDGNIQNAPASYRSFFLKEEQRYLGL